MLKYHKLINSHHTLKRLLKFRILYYNYIKDAILIFTARFKKKENYPESEET